MEKVLKVIWGIIGAGDVCEVKSAPAMYSIANSEVKMVMRRNAAKASDFAKRHGITSWTTDIDELLNDPEINAVYIATPPDSHAAIALQCAGAACLFPFRGSAHYWYVCAGASRGFAAHKKYPAYHVPGDGVAG